MTPKDTNSSKLPIIATIFLGVLVAISVYCIGILVIAIIYSIIIYSVAWINPIYIMNVVISLWSEPTAWVNPIILIILVISLILSTITIFLLYILLARSFGSDTNIGTTPKYIYIIAVLISIIPPSVAYSYSQYYNYRYETQLTELEKCLGMDVGEYTERCKQLVDDYFESGSLEPQELDTNQSEQDQL